MFVGPVTRQGGTRTRLGIVTRGNANCSLLRFPGNIYLLDLTVILGKKSGPGWYT